MSELQRGDIWWADLPEPHRSEPGHRRPVPVVLADSFNRSRIQTAIVAVITTNLDLAEAPGNVLLPAPSAGQPRDSAVNVGAPAAVDHHSSPLRASGCLLGLLARMATL